MGGCLSKMLNVSKKVSIERCQYDKKQGKKITVELNKIHSNNNKRKY